MRDELGRQVILFHLKRFWEGQVGSIYIKDLDLYEEIKAGRKTSEWRDNTEYWRSRLCSSLVIPRPHKVFNIAFEQPDMRAWFVVGYPKGNLPRLEATITEVVESVGYSPLGIITDSDQIEVKFKDVVEVKT